MLSGTRLSEGAMSCLSEGLDPVPGAAAGEAQVVQVGVRVRPLNQRELEGGQEQVWTIKGNTISARTQSVSSSAGAAATASGSGGGGMYTFDHIFHEAGNQEIYNQLAKGIIASCLRGVNGTLFAYGQTSSGKTHTMLGHPLDPGIIPLAVADIFAQIQQSPDREFRLRVSYVEIYNEVIKDLLNPGNSNLKIHENVSREIFVGGLTERTVVSLADVERLMTAGEANRHVGVTNMNERSSRSHTIFRMVIESRARPIPLPASPGGVGGDTGESADLGVRVSTLNLVDLAGSERAGSTGAEGLRLKEGGHINKSLLALTNVITKLSSGDRTHIPYRNSKLTRILQPSLGGNARTAIICTVTPASLFVENTNSTLSFASRAKRIVNTPEVNQIMTIDEQLQCLQRENRELKARLLLQRIGGGPLYERNAPPILEAADVVDAQVEQEDVTTASAPVRSPTKRSQSFLAEQPSPALAKRICANRRQTWFPGLQIPFCPGSHVIDAVAEGEEGERAISCPSPAEHGDGLAEGSNEAAPDAARQQEEPAEFREVIRAVEHQGTQVSPAPEPSELALLWERVAPLLGSDARDPAEQIVRALCQGQDQNQALRALEEARAVTAYQLAALQRQHATQREFLEAEASISASTLSDSLAQAQQEMEALRATIPPARMSADAGCATDPVPMTEQGSDPWDRACVEVACSTEPGPFREQATGTDSLLTAEQGCDAQAWVALDRAEELYVRNAQLEGELATAQSAADVARADCTALLESQGRSTACLAEREEARILELRELTQRLVAEREAWQAERQQLAEQLQASGAQRAEAEARLAELTSERGAWYAERQQLAEQLQTSGSQHAETKARLSGLSGDLDAAKAALSLLVDEASSLRAELVTREEALAEARCEGARHAAAIAELTQKGEGVLAGLQAQVQQAQEERDELAQALADAKQQLTARAIEVEQAFADAQASKAAGLEEARRAGEAESASLQERLAEHGEALALAQARSAELEAQLDVIRAELAEQKAARHELREQLATTSMTAAVHEAALVRASSQLQDMEAAHQQRQLDLEAQLQELRKELPAVRVQLAQSQQEVTDLQERSQASAHREGEMAGQLAMLTTALQAKEAELAGVQAEVDALSRKQLESMRLLKDRQHAQAKLERKHATAVAQQEARVAELQSAVSGHDAHLAQERKGIEDRVAALMASLRTESEAARQGLQERLDAASDVVRAAEQQRSEWAEERAHLQQALDEGEKRYRILLHRETSLLKVELKNKLACIQELRRENEDLLQQRPPATSCALSEETDQLQALREQEQTMAHQLHELRRDKEAWDARMHELDQRRGELQRLNMELEVKLTTEQAMRTAEVQELSRRLQERGRADGLAGAKVAGTSLPADAAAAATLEGQENRPASLSEQAAATGVAATSRRQARQLARQTGPPPPAGKEECKQQ